ncbi:MAG: RrF2 family transcriptional regulator [Deltaproteobacteria bacterium]|nr:RrF2 family transcriptional regulator [Deltaproteobacteria bacterium]
MKLSTRSRYGTRMMADLAKHYDEGPVQIGSIAKRQDVSVKYLEQLIIPLKKSGFIKSVRGPRGGHMLSRPPEEITVGEIVRVLEGGIDLTGCIKEVDSCERSSNCLMRKVWEEASSAIYETLYSKYLTDII